MDYKFKKRFLKWTLDKTLEKGKPPEINDFRGSLVAGVDEISNLGLLRSLAEVIAFIDER